MAKYVAAVIVGFLVGFLAHVYVENEDRINFARSLGVSSFTEARNKISGEYFEIRNFTQETCLLEDQLEAAKGKDRQRLSQQLKVRATKYRELADKYNGYWSGSAVNFSPKWGILETVPPLSQFRQTVCNQKEVS